MRYLLYFIVVVFFQNAGAQNFQKTKGMEHYKGYFNFYYDVSSDKIYLEVNKLNEEFLYVNALAAGVGSNDIGLDRGQLGETAVVKFIKAGNKLLLIQPNLNYRAITAARAFTYKHSSFNLLTSK